MFTYAIVLFLIWIWILQTKFNEKWAPLEKVPGPKGFPIIGNILDVSTDMTKSLDDIKALTKKYGDIFKLKIGPLGYNVMISKPEYIEILLSSQIHTYKGALYQLFDDWVGKGLLVSNDEKWKDARKLIGPVFSTKLIERFCETFDERNKEFIEELKQIGEDAFDIHHLETKNGFLQVFRTLVGKQIKLSVVDDYINHCAIIIAINIPRYFSLKRFKIIFKRTNHYKITMNSIACTQKIIRDIIKDRREVRKLNPENNIGNKTFLDLLLDIQKESNDVITDLDIIHQLDTFLFAGHDTVTGSVSFAIYELSCNRDIQEKLLGESNGIFGTDLSTVLTMRKLEEAKYLDMFCKEVLRKHTIAPMYERTTREPLQFDDIKIPIGTIITMLPYCTHLNENYYPNPDQFDPDRFLPENKVKRPECAFLPFSHGPRNCIGQRFAMVEMKSTIISLVRNFIIKKGHPHFQPITGQGSTLKILNGILVKLQVR